MKTTFGIILLVIIMNFKKRYVFSNLDNTVYFSTNF